MTDDLQTGAMQSAQAPRAAGKSPAVRWTEGTLYFLMSALVPIVQELDGNDPLDARNVTKMTLSAIATGCMALKAYLSTGGKP